jgi:hypothetical protein
MGKKIMAMLSFLILAAFLFSLEIRQIIQSPIRILTEGNTFGKQFVFLFYLFALLLSQIIIPKLPSLKKYLEKSKLDLQKAIVILVIGGFALSLIMQLYFQSYYGIGNDDYAAHVTNCGEAVCWEATYLQHTHIPKTSLYYLEKTLGFDVGNLVDDGKPMFEITPFIPLFAPFVLVLLLLLGFFGILLASIEKSTLRLAFLFLGLILSIIAIFDGGVFTITGVNAITSILLYFAFEKKLLGMDGLAVPIVIAMFAILLSNFGFWFLGTQLYFRDWFVVPLFLISSFVLFRANNKPKLFFFAIFSLSVILFYQAASLDISGSNAADGHSILVYGLPGNVGTQSIADSLAIPASRVQKYGWYAKINGDMALSTREIEEKLRAKFVPKGYLFAEIDEGKNSIKAISIIINSWPNAVSLQDSFSTYSFTPINVTSTANGLIVLGNSTLNGPHLALEIGSYLHSKGIDAIVISKVI